MSWLVLIALALAHLPILQIWISFTHNATVSLAEDQKCVHRPTCMMIGHWFLLVALAAVACMQLLQMIAAAILWWTARIGVIRTKLALSDYWCFLWCICIPLICHNDRIVFDRGRIFRRIIVIDGGRCLHVIIECSIEWFRHILQTITLLRCI